MGGALLAIPRVNTAMEQNVEFDGTKPHLKRGSPASKLLGNRHNWWVANRVEPEKKMIRAQIKSDPEGFKRRMKKRGIVVKYVTDAQLKRRKRLSADAAIATSTLSLGALGAKGGGSVLRRVGAVKKVPRLMKLGRKIDRAAVPVSLTSGGIGGLSGYNYASIQRTEAKRRNQAVLHKAYDPEWNRQRRNKVEAVGLAGAGTAALGGAGYHGYRSEKANRTRVSEAQRRYGQAQRNTQGSYKARNTASQGMKNAEFTLGTASRLRADADDRNLTSSVKASRTKDVNRAKASLSGAKTEYERLSGAAKQARRAQAGAFRRVGQAKRLRAISRGKTGALALAGAGALGGAAYVAHKPKTKSWASYSPRYRPQS